jgi:pyridoxine 4-dehydrogenase
MSSVGRLSASIRVPRDEQFGAIKTLLDEGVIHDAGLSGVSVAEVEAASKLFKVATVQNRYNLANRSSEDVLEHCKRHSIGFIPWFPLGAGELARPGTPLNVIAKVHGQIALAWVLKRTGLLPIPARRRWRHLEENVAAARIMLTDAEFAELDRFGRSVER